jgi:hypothetical protein
MDDEEEDDRYRRTDGGLEMLEQFMTLEGEKST